MALTSSQQDVTLGPVFFNWGSDRLRDFYARIADEAPVDRVYLGEIVCGKRTPLIAETLVDASERLRRAGMRVIWSSLIAPTNRRERASMEALAGFDDEVEVNDIGALAGGLEHGFTAGTFLNIYNEATLETLARLGCVRWCPPVELSLDAVAKVHSAQPDIAIEVFAFGRLPLAHSSRCYHARHHGLNKDSCRYVCEMDPDGCRVDTLDGEAFLAFNGVQTLSDSVQVCDAPPDVLRDAGVGALRLSPQTGDMVAVAHAFRDRLDGRIDATELKARLASEALGRPMVNGYLNEVAGMQWCGS